MSKGLKEAYGDVFIKVIVTCPHCDEVMDLAESQTFESLHCDGRLSKKIFSENSVGCDDLEETVECPDCGGKIRIGIIYG